jgi:hypothetical protein
MDVPGPQRRVDVEGAFILSPAQEALGVVIIILPDLSGISGSVRHVHAWFHPGLRRANLILHRSRSPGQSGNSAPAINIRRLLDIGPDLVKFYINEI